MKDLYSSGFVINVFQSIYEGYKPINQLWNTGDFSWNFQYKQTSNKTQILEILGNL